MATATKDVFTGFEIENGNATSVELLRAIQQFGGYLVQSRTIEGLDGLNPDEIISAATTIVDNLPNGEAADGEFSANQKAAQSIKSQYDGRFFTRGETTPILEDMTDKEKVVEEIRQERAGLVAEAENTKQDRDFDFAAESRKALEAGSTEAAAERQIGHGDDALGALPERVITAAIEKPPTPPTLEQQLAEMAKSREARGLLQSVRVAIEHIATANPKALAQSRASFESENSPQKLTWWQRKRGMPQPVGPEHPADRYTAAIAVLEVAERTLKSAVSTTANQQEGRQSPVESRAVTKRLETLRAQQAVVGKALEVSRQYWTVGKQALSANKIIQNAQLYAINERSIATGELAALQGARAGGEAAMQTLKIVEPALDIARSRLKVVEPILVSQSAVDAKRLAFDEAKASFAGKAPTEEVNDPAARVLTAALDFLEIAQDQNVNGSAIALAEIHVSDAFGPAAKEFVTRINEIQNKIKGQSLFLSVGFRSAACTELATIRGSMHEVASRLSGNIRSIFIDLLPEGERETTREEADKRATERQRKKALGAEAEGGPGFTS